MSKFFYKNIFRMSQNLWTHWQQPPNNTPQFATGLKLMNNLTGGTLVDFHPIQGKQVK